jgi:hypothetical protein
MNWSPGENPELDRRLAQLDEELPRPSNEADEGTRTPDPLLTMEVLYQLSYVGMSSGGSRIRTCVGRAARFTAALLWPLGHPPER